MKNNRKKGTFDNRVVGLYFFHSELIMNRLVKII